jgi:hypothetical protein
MNTDRLVVLSHTGPARSQGRACLVYLRGGGILTEDWYAFAHRDGWGLPATPDPEILELAKAARGAGVEVGCRLRRRPDYHPPYPPVYDVVDEYDDGGICLLGDVPTGRALFAVERVQRANHLAQIYRSAPDPVFREQALAMLRRFGLGTLPSLRVPNSKGMLAKPGSWVETVLRHAHEVLMSGGSATERSAELYWLLHAIPRYTSSGMIRPASNEDEVGDME